MKLKLLILKYRAMRKLGILKPAKSLDPYATPVSPYAGLVADGT